MHHQKRYEYPFNDNFHLVFNQRYERQLKPQEILKVFNDLVLNGGREASEIIISHSIVFSAFNKITIQYFFVVP